MDVLEKKAIYINDGRIQEIGPVDELRTKYDKAEFTIELNDEDIVLPDLINTHGHACMTADRLRRSRRRQRTQ